MLAHTVVNQTTATFKNVLTVNKDFIDMMGDYSCSVVNIVFGSSERETIHLKGNSCVKHRFNERLFAQAQSHQIRY